MEVPVHRNLHISNNAKVLMTFKWLFVQFDHEIIFFHNLRNPKTCLGFKKITGFQRAVLELMPPYLTNGWYELHSESAVHGKFWLLCYASKPNNSDQ